MFEVIHFPKSLALSFSASLDNVDKAAEETQRFLSEIHAEQHVFAVTLVLREGLTNAVVGGSGMDDNKVIDCLLRLEGDVLVMEIEDKGHGFDWKAYLHHLPPADEESGRGLPIMEHYCDAVQYNEQGNRLILRKLIR